MGITLDLATYLAEGHLEDVPKPVQQRAKEIIMDTLGVTVSGSLTPSATLAREHVAALEGKPVASVLGHTLRTSSPLAAFANGVASHAQDYDDSNFQLLGHSSGATCATLLALAEQEEASGRDFLRAFIYSFEMAIRLAKGLMPYHYQVRGWHHVGTLTTVRAAAAGANLLGLDAQRSAWALGIASSMAGGLRGNTGTYTKAMHAGNSAYNGVTAALLARRGFTGGITIFEHDYGFCNAMNGSDHVRWDVIEGEMGNRERWGLLDPGVGLKMHPCNTAVHPAIQVTIRLAKEHDIRPEEVERVEYGHSPTTRKVAYFDDPRDGPEAMYSMTHAVAVALTFRRAGVQEFTDEATRHPLVTALRQRVHLYEHPEIAGLPEVADFPASHITIHLKGGRTVSGYQQRPKAYPGGEPATHEELVGKFLDCATQGIPRSRAEAAVELMDRLERLSKVSELTQVLSRAG